MNEEEKTRKKLRGELGKGRASRVQLGGVFGKDGYI